MPDTALRFEDFSRCMVDDIIHATVELTAEKARKKESMGNENGADEVREW